MPVRLGWSQVHLCQWENVRQRNMVTSPTRSDPCCACCSYGIRIRSCLLRRAGLIPPVLGRLMALTRLSLDNNALSGESVPPFCAAPVVGRCPCSHVWPWCEALPRKGPNPYPRASIVSTIERANFASCNTFMFPMGKHDFWMHTWYLYLKAMSCYGE